MNIDKTYDYIIYSASLAGVLTAIDLSKKDNSVLLLNFYGFMGGSITECLNCFQTIYAKNFNGSAKSIFEKISSTKDGILFQSDNEFVLNPETVKIVLQEVIENSKVELLFHIVPFYLKQQDDFVELSVTGKEGIFHLKGETIIDASDEYDLLKLANADRILVNLFNNLFLTGLKDDSWQSYGLIENKIKLNDDRFWISLKLPQPQNVFFIENNSQRIINAFEEEVHKNGGRIQLIAPQSQKIFRIEEKKISESIFHIKSELSNTFSAQEIFKELSALNWH